MTDKITLASVGTLIDTTTAGNTINNNFSIIQTAFDNTLSRDGTVPNTMGNNIDMNSNQILNLPAPATVNSPARLIDVTGTPTITVPPVGTSGAVVGLLNTNNTISGNNTYSGTSTFSGNVSAGGTLGVTGASTFTGAVVMNGLVTATGGVTYPNFAGVITGGGIFQNSNQLCFSGGTNGYRFLNSAVSSPIVDIGNTGILTLYSTTSSTTTNSGALICAGGIGVAGSASLSTVLTNTINDSTNSKNVIRRGSGTTIIGTGDVLTITDNAGSVFIGSILSSGATGIGYATGAGGTVTQVTSRTTGVTLNKVSGAITLFTAAGATTAVTFTVTNSTVAATDTITLSQKSGTNLYNFIVTAVAAGSFNITFYTTGGTASDAPVINFNVIKGVTS